jgi:hypothetical protein
MKKFLIFLAAGFFAVITLLILVPRFTDVKYRWSTHDELFYLGGGAVSTCGYLGIWSHSYRIKFVVHEYGCMPI